MTRTPAFLIVAAALLAGPAWANGQHLVLFPGGLAFTPLRANVQEPRIGLVKAVDDGEMRVDIGNSVDVISLRSNRLIVTAGIDFFAYALVTGNDGLRLQIDAVDGFFGGNLSAHTAGSRAPLWSARLRLLHHSAHMVDGRSRAPVPFTQDFGELVIAHRPTPLTRLYGGFSYATLIRPAEIGRFAYLAGAEAADDRIIGPLAGQPVNLFVAYNASLSGTPVTAASHGVQAGAKLGEFTGRGVALFAEWYSGRHMLAQYYDVRTSYIGVGFAVDFF